MRLGFILGEIGSGLRRNLSMVVSVILVTAVSLGFVGAAIGLQVQIGTMKDYWYDKVQVSVFLCNAGSPSPACAAGAVTDEQRKNVEAILNSAGLKPDIKSYVYESQAEALEHYKDQFKNSAIASSVTADQLPSSYRVNMVNAEKYQVVSEALSSVPGVDQVVDQRKALEPLFEVMNRLTAVAVGVALVMILTAWLLIATTIRLSAFSRRRETGIMRLVGASKTVIQLPFIMEGVISAVIGAGIAWLAIWGSIKIFVEGASAANQQSIALISAADVWWIGPILIGIGIFVSAFSSWITLRKYLKV
ncbi:cell division protein [Renibacterium salmoninarum ATCC 33209]|uniref:Cell division protein FtsX n=1 Tax=Renibacterium salmoninarum (strain ATCC 33209 / DSM 20767 / JCM 11484 / NBRC 15589 / NCIMB 2235) TaxID=288705 RepID=A9WPT8_RENSM|nr:permease-like cell division protein FtsX [Renibacterium salmoninarum]ABY23095.1 cell division protein [Renibacterium salmoninarum ATCC 33209]